MSTLSKDKRESDEIGYYDAPVMVETLESCWGLGPLDVCAKLVSSDRIEVSIKLAGIKIGSGTITAKDTNVCASANAGLVKASVCVKGDFPNKKVWVEGEVCTRKWTGGWDCNGFKTIIIAW